jgi:hypothetical protein
MVILTAEDMVPEQLKQYLWLDAENKDRTPRGAKVGNKAWNGDSQQKERKRQVIIIRES